MLPTKQRDLVFLRGPVVEARGIEPRSENVEASGVYVRIWPFASSRFARASALASGLFTC